MIKNFFKIALRNIKKYKAHTFLNISGMAISMAAAILILLWVQDEISYDRFHKNADNLYRVLQNFYVDEGQAYPVAVTPAPLAPALKEEYPEIIRASRYQSYPMPLQKGDEYINEIFALVDKDFLEMFNIKFVHGDIQSTLTGPHNIAITEEMADKYFADKDPLGKTLTSKGYVFTVTGVIQRLPQNSHIQFDFLVSFGFRGTNLNNWGGSSYYTYVELLEGTDSKSVDIKIRDITKKHNDKLNTTIFLQNIKKIHLFSSGVIEKDISGNGDIAHVKMMVLIAVFILFIACINFMNLSTAQSAGRAREIGVCKVVGANRRRIYVQFMGESVLIVFVAHVIAMIFVESLLPGFNNLTGKQLDVNYLSAGLYIGLIAILFFCGLLAGSYPAFYLSSLKPMNIIKGVINKNPGNTQFRRVLVIFQFSLSVLLIICTLIVRNQLNYMQNKNLGLNKDNIVYFKFDSPHLGEILKKDLSNNPDIVSVTFADQNPLSVINAASSSIFDWEGKKKGNDVIFSAIGINEDFAKTFQIELIDGGFSSSEYSNDNTIVINEQAAKIMGFKDPIGKMLSSNGPKCRIIGVVKDFNFKSLHTKIEPLIMMMNKNVYSFCFIRMTPDHITSTVDYIKKTFKTYNLPYPLEFNFLDDYYDNLYRKEQRMGKIFGYFSFLAIFISCLGLIGLSSFMTERRTKEIGIRKANGAKPIQIFTLLSGEYISCVSISVMTAFPIAWFAMHKWLDNFAYKTGIDWQIFALAGLLALVITLLTVSWQSWRAATRNPAEALRYE